MLAGIQTEIKQLQAEEARRQAQLVAQARARLAAQQRAASASRVAGRRARRRRLSRSAVGTSDYLTPTPPPPSQYGGVVGIAMQYLGTPYVWGGSSPGGFDCSGLVAYAYAQFGVSLPHNAAAMYSYGTPVSSSDLQAGDLVFFSGLGHMGIYIGGGQFIHAPHTGDVVKISNMSDHGELRRGATPLAVLGADAPTVALRLSYRRVDRVGEVLHDRAPLQLQGRRHLVLLHREVARQDHELLDLLVA